MADAQEPMAVAFEPASSANDAEWLSSALRRGQWTRVSAVIPSGFEAYAVLRHPAYRCVSTKNNLVDIRYGKYIRSETIGWSEVAKSDLPVVYGRTSYEESVDSVDSGNPVPSSTRRKMGPGHIGDWGFEPGGPGRR